MFDKKIFSQRLSNLRISKNISRTGLALELGLSYDSVAKMEKAERACSVEILYALSKYFDVSSDYLLGLSDSPK